MSLREEWDAMRAAVERVAIDATRLTTVTRQEREGGEVARIESEVQLDGDTTIKVSGGGAQLGACHRAAVAFTSELAGARLRMLTRVVGAILP